MHGEKTPDAVAGTVIVVQPRLPKRRTRQRVDLYTGGLLRKDQGCDGDVALKNTGEAVT